MPPTLHGTLPLVRIGGRPLGEAFAADLTSVVIELSLSAAGMCVMTFADPGRDLLNRLSVAFGDAVAVDATPVESNETSGLFRGKVYGLDIDFNEGGSFVLVRAYDSSFPLRQVRHSRVFQNVTDGDVLRTLAGEEGVPAAVGGDANRVVHEHLTMTNETPWDFLVRRALSANCILYMAEGKLTMSPFPNGTSAPTPGDHESTDWRQLVPGHNLRHLHLRQSAAQQFESVEARGWDPQQKRALVGTAPTSSVGASPFTSAADLGRRHGGGTRVTSAPGESQQAGCDLLAKSLADRVGSTHVYGEGEAIGDPRLVAGVAVSIGQAAAFKGKYVLSTTRHVFGEGGYRTEFTISGAHDRSVFGLLAAKSIDVFPGVYPALVSNNDDPEKLGRVRLRFAWLDEKFESGWARVMTIGGGRETGLQWPPEIDDEVLVAFTGGDPANPVVLGGMHNGIDKPPERQPIDTSNGSVATRVMQTRLGHRLVFSDKNGAEHILLETADHKVSVQLDQSGREVTITSSGAVNVVAKGNVQVKADGKIDLESKGNITLKADGSGTISAMTGLKIESNGQVEIKGTQIKLN